jgi:hypothetical protein
MFFFHLLFSFRRRENFSQKNGKLFHVGPALPFGKLFFFLLPRQSCATYFRICARMQASSRLRKLINNRIINGLVTKPIINFKYRLNTHNQFYGALLDRALQQVFAFHIYLRQFIMND